MKPVSFEALGTIWWLEVWDEMTVERSGEVFDFAASFCHSFNDRYSRFLPNSEISRLNRDRRLLACPDTQQLLQMGVDLFRKTRGIFNILTGHILEARGYDGAYSFIDKGSDSLESGNPLTDLEITNDLITLHYGNLDLGGYGKGYCIDRLAEALIDRFGLEQFLINGGGDMLVTHKNGEAVEIHFASPHDPSKLTGRTCIKNCAFAASSPHLRRWPRVLPEHRDASGHSSLKHEPMMTHTHIVSQTTEPTKDSIYLTAPTATLADAFATTLLQVDDTAAATFAADNHLHLL